VVGALDSGMSNKSNRPLAALQAPYSAGRSAGEGRCAVESVVTDELDFENAAKWLATEWGHKHEEDDKAAVARDAALRVGTSGGGAGSPGSALQHFGTGCGGIGGGGGGGGGCEGDCPPDSYRKTSGDTDKKPEPPTPSEPPIPIVKHIGASSGTRAKEMPEHMKDYKDLLLIDRVQDLLLSQGVSQKMVSLVEPSHASLQKWMAKRKLIPVNDCDGHVQGSIALIRAISIKALVKDKFTSSAGHAQGASINVSCTTWRSTEEEAKGTITQNLESHLKSTLSLIYSLPHSLLH
jgi:hypothetical protein